MVDMLVRLYDLPDSGQVYAKARAVGVTLRRPGAFEKHLVEEFVRVNFSAKWVSETQVAFSREPVSIFIATKDRKVLGFACYGTSARGFFGPTGVAEEARGLGVGKALLFLALEALRAEGHAYGFIGGVGPREFYEKAVGATVIEGSDPGIYADLLPEP